MKDMTFDRNILIELLNLKRGSKGMTTTMLAKNLFPELQQPYTPNNIKRNHLLRKRDFFVRRRLEKWIKWNVVHVNKIGKTNYYKVDKNKCQCRELHIVASENDKSTGEALIAVLVKPDNMEKGLYFPI